MKKNLIFTVILASMLLAGCGQISPLSDTASSATNSTSTGIASSDTTSPYSSAVASSEAAAEANGSTQAAEADSSEGTASGYTANTTESTSAADTSEKPSAEPSSPEIVTGIEEAIVDIVPNEGTAYLTPSLKNAIKENPNSVFAVQVHVFDPDIKQRRNAFLSTYTADGYTYDKVIAEMTEAENEISELKLNIYTSGMTPEAERRIEEINGNISRLGKIRDKMLAAANNSCMKAEMSRLSSHGIKTEGRTSQYGDFYIVAYVSADEIAKMPFDSRISYILSLTT